ncbi:MAG: hydroxylamine reductase [Acidobacteriaceae bacterium]|jgi:hydroxylamine reductase
MFCYQCEQTSKGVGCQTQGVCGKDETIAALHDLLTHAVKGISVYAHHARLLGAADERLRVCDPEVDAFVIEALFATLTNVNFDKDRLVALIYEAVAMRAAARCVYERAAGESGIAAVPFGGAAVWIAAETVEELIAQGRSVTLPARILYESKEIANLQELVLYGIKGVAAYAAHALALGAGDPESFGKIHEALCFLTHEHPSVAELLAMALSVGELNYRVLEVLDKAHTGTFGNPRPTRVRLGARKGKAILVSGHDLHDLYALLEQTRGTGIEVYTHGEMLPAHGYPKLRAFAHLAGNYGGAWMDQAADFAAFPGAILMTSNCMQQPKASYGERIFTSSAVNWPGVRHVEGKEFGPVIEAALAAEGFTEAGGREEIMVGFGHHAVLSVADKLVEAVKSGKLRHLFLIAGCDGARSERSYYTELAKAVPEDCAILTLACGKYRFNKLAFGEVAGLPRLMDMGQCNDAYSAVQVTLALAKALECGVNDLPLSLVLSWYEQKAIAVVLTLLWLGVKNIRIGPTLPAFLSPGVMALLREHYNLMAIGTPKEDLAAMVLSPAKTGPARTAGV